MKSNTYRKNINRMAFPILLNYLLTSIFEILDKAIVGHYSVQGFAVVGVAASVIYAVTGALGILSASFNIIAAEEKGKKNEAGFETTFLISKRLAIIIGSLFFVLSILGGKIFFRNLYGLEGEALQELLSYFYPAAFTVLQNMLIFQYSAYFRNCLDTKITLYSTIVSTIVNLILDYSLVYGAFGLPQMGTAGAAWGSVIGLAAGLLVYQTAYYRRKGRIAVKLKEWGIFRRILSLYPSLLGQELLEGTIFVLVVSAVVTRLGTEQMAVYSLLESVESAIGLPVYAYATAAQTYSLQSHSAGETDKVAHYLKTGMKLAFLLILTLCVLCGIFRMQVLGLIVASGAVIAAAEKMLGILFLVQLSRIPYQIYLSFLQGIGKEKLVFLCTAAGTLVASGAVVLFGNRFGLWGVYGVVMLEFVILTLVYRSRIIDE